jgi:hypothetical protein
VAGPQRPATVLDSDPLPGTPILQSGSFHFCPPRRRAATREGLVLLDSTLPPNLDFQIYCWPIIASTALLPASVNLKVFRACLLVPDFFSCITGAGFRALSVSNALNVQLVAGELQGPI